MRSPFTALLRPFVALALCIGCMSGASPALQAQVLDQTLFTAGTVTRNAANQHWAYLALQIDDPLKLRQRKIAVYSKAGQPGSPNAFVRKGVITVQTDPLILQTLISRAVNLGESAAELEFALNEIFGELVPDPSLALKGKLSAVIQGALADPQQYGSLVLLSRTHPAVALSLGLAWAEPIPAGDSTFELREFDVAKGMDTGVVGRVTVTAGAPVVLPAPSRPVDVPDLSAKGHLNSRMRWGTPVALRRLSLLHFGFTGSHHLLHRAGGGTDLQQPESVRTQCPRRRRAPRPGGTRRSQRRGVCGMLRPGGRRRRDGRAASDGW